MNKFTHIGKALGEAVLTTPTADGKAGSWTPTQIRRPGVLERTEMQHNDFPDTAYTTTWSNGRGEVRFFTRSDGSRLRYYTHNIAGTGPPLVLMHTVRTQLDYFQRNLGTSEGRRCRFENFVRELRIVDCAREDQRTDQLGHRRECLLPAPRSRSARR